MKNIFISLFLSFTIITCIFFYAISLSIFIYFFLIHNNIRPISSKSKLLISHSTLDFLGLIETESGLETIFYPSEPKTIRRASASRMGAPEASFLLTPTRRPPRRRVEDMLGL